MASEDKPRPAHRFITTHDPDGRSIFSQTLKDTAPLSVASGAQISFCYATQNFPVDIEGEKDIERYSHFITKSPGLVVANGSAARMIDFPPGYASVMHRAISVNYNFVIEGELEVTLDSGEKKTLKPGDTLVQRAINHAWRNKSDTKWARLAAVSFAAVAPVGLKEAGTEGILEDH